MTVSLLGRIAQRNNTACALVLRPPCGCFNGAGDRRSPTSLKPAFNLATAQASRTPILRNLGLLRAFSSSAPLDPSPSGHPIASPSASEQPTEAIARDLAPNYVLFDAHEQLEQLEAALTAAAGEAYVSLDCEGKDLGG